MTIKKGESGVWVVIIILVVLVAGWLVINNVYVTVYSEKASTNSYYCENGLIKQKEGGLVGMIGTSIETMSCYAFPNSRYEIVCENNVPVLHCKVTIYQRFFATQKYASFP